MPIIIGFLGIALWMRIATIMEPVFGRKKWINLLSDMDVGSTVITFYGTALRIESLNGKRLTVAGRVARIDFAPKWEVDANEAPHSGSR